MKRLKSIGLIDTVPGMKALDMNTTEDTIVRHTREVVPGMIVTGMVAEIDGAPRMVKAFTFLVSYICSELLLVLIKFVG